MSEKLAWAHHWALQGLHIFPVYPNTKRPVNAGWPDAATCDPAQIDRWWNECPDYNIGCAPGKSGHAVIDLDVKKTDGFAAMRQLEADLGELPATFVTETASGGRHVWLKLEGSCKNSASKLALGIDTRGNRGYVLMPGSEFEGKPYITAVDAPIAEAPARWRDALKALGRSDERRKADEGVEIDTPEQVRRAETYLQGLVSADDVAVEGAGGNTRTFRLFAMLRDMGLSEDKALELVEAHWNEACRPPWDIEELDTIARNAYSYAQNEEGAKAQGDGSGFASIPVPAGSQAIKTQKQSRFEPLNIVEMSELTEPAWLVPGWIPHYEPSLIYGAPGSMKSFVSLDLGLSVAAGLETWGLRYAARRFPVIYIAGEGQIGVAKKRIPAWIKHRDIKTEIPFHLIREAPLARNGNDELAELFAAIEKKCGSDLPRLVIFDTHARVMSGLDENSVQDTSKTIEFYDAIRRRYSCAALIVHHSGKDGAQERGSSALRGACETVLRMDKDGAGSNVLRCEKMKDAEAPRPIAFGTIKVDQSIVLAPRDIVAKEHAPSDLYIQVIDILKEHGAYTLGSAITTKTLAADLIARRAEEGTTEDEYKARRKMEQTLARASKRELKALTLPDITPMQWLLPPLNAAS